jgi:hypothetical protein
VDAITATLTSTLTVRDTPRDTKGLTRARGGEGEGRRGKGGELPIFSFISPWVSKSLSEFFCPKNRFPLFPSSPPIPLSPFHFPYIRFAIFCNLLLILQEPSAPVALQGRLCLSAKPHEFKRSLISGSTCPLSPSWEYPGRE